MNDDIAKLLTFQKADLEYRNLERRISDSEFYKKMQKSKKAFDAAKQKIAESEALAGSVIAACTSAGESLNGCVARAEELCAILAGEPTEEEEKRAADELEALRANIGEWEKKLSQAKASADRALSDYRAAQESGKNARNEYAAAKNKFEGVRNENEGKLSELKAARDKLMNDVPSELMATYNALAAERKFPAFVPASGDEKAPSCGACGMALAEQAKNELKSGGVCRCETCGRMIYKV